VQLLSQVGVDVSEFLGSGAAPFGPIEGCEHLQYSIDLVADGDLGAESTGRCDECEKSQDRGLTQAA
jgi:hypothetical protein